MSNMLYDIETDAEVSRLSEVTDFLEQHLTEAGCPVKAQLQISVAAEEIFVNIASYAYAPGSGKAKIELQIEDDPGAAVITFKDSGVPFNPFLKEDPDVTLKAEEREIGGLGIYMTKKTMDDVRYEYKDGLNILTLKKIF